MSQYLTIHDLTSGASAYQTISTTTSSQQSAAITARRIMITTGNLTQYVQFGTSPVVTTGNGFVIPSNTTMLFNFRSGDKVAVVSTAASSMSITDLD
jgi:hypothetical protein